MITALVALLVAEHVAGPVAQARVAAIVEACEAAAPGDALMVALCAINAYRESRMDPTRVGDHGQAIGAWQLHRWTPLPFGAACGRDRRDVRASACMFVASIRYWMARTPTLEAAMSSHMSGRTRPAGPKGRARVAWVRIHALSQELLP